MGKEMTREELEELEFDTLDLLCGASLRHTKGTRRKLIKIFRDACIRYGFEKARETKDTGEYMNDLPIVVNKYETADDIIDELDKEQDGNS